MTNFESVKVVKTFTQTNLGPPDKVFPLLCPVREKDWLIDWDYEMVYSRSGLVEEGCVFLTDHHGKQPTVWVVSKHDPENYMLEFIRTTPGEMVVRIFITCTALEEGQTKVRITYEYTSLSAVQSNYLQTEIDRDFEQMMHFWETAINHYLIKGEPYRG